MRHACHGDYLELFSGLIQSPASLLGRYCGWQLPNTTALPIRRHLTIKFVTDAADGYRGFKFIAIKTRKCEFVWSLDKMKLQLFCFVVVGFLFVFFTP